VRNLNLPQALIEYKKAGLKFAFVIQGGNQGDQMIYAGAEKMAELLGISHTTHYCLAPPNNPNIPQFDEQTVIYMHGGGGFNRWWAWSPELLRLLRDRNPKNHIIVGPSTFELDKGYLKSKLPSDIVYFTREFSSYEYLKPLLPYVHVDHDTALHLSLGDGYLDRLLGFRQPSMKHRLLAIRGDVESAKLPTGIKAELFNKIVDPCVEKDWAGLHLDASIIVTNRCHSAILGCLLRKRTVMFAGSYHKNKSIWEYSLRERGVEWLE